MYEPKNAHVSELIAAATEGPNIAFPALIGSTKQLKEVKTQPPRELCPQPWLRGVCPVPPQALLPGASPRAGAVLGLALGALL
mmetsp:Transcript_31348/g.74339  ORF Transcript_31348/g.74339 Transcript_31348/m.74339 type:complete len:83 (+) Transcript_31348:153-401(+)